MTSRRVLTWCCVILLAVLSLLPAAEMTRTGFPGEIEHLSPTPGRQRSRWQATARGEVSRGSSEAFGCMRASWKYLQHFSPGRHPAIEDFAASALGALRGGVVIALLWRRASILRR
jgi:hypothetical protein